MMNLYEDVYSPDVQKRQLILIPNEETSKYFSSCYIGVKDFLKCIRNYPEIIYRIIKSADKKYFMYHFNYFILNNFFEDILFPNIISKDFIYVIEHLLNDIVSKLENPLDFVNKYENSNLSYLLDGLLYKREIQIFFNSILSNIIEDYTSSGKSSKVLLFEVGELNTFIKNREINYKHLMRNSDLTKKKELEIKKKEQIDAFNNIFRMRINSYENSSSIDSLYDFEEENLLAQNLDENEEFVTKYFQELEKSDLKKLIQNKNNKDNKNSKEYIQYQLSFLNKNESLFSNKIFLEKVQKSKESEKILFFYERNFLIIINIIDQILEQIQINICIIPPIIKCIFKILTEVLKNKFPHIKNLELYINISAIVIRLINNCFSNHEYNALFSSIIFGSRLRRNLNVILPILSHLISFKLYNSEEKSDYTPFNLYFLEKYNIIFDIYDKILDFNISDITISHRKKSLKIFQFHNNKNLIIDNNINNNKDKLFNSISICYNVEDITTLLNVIKHNLDYLLEEKITLYPVDEFKIIYEKLRDNKEIFKTLKEKDHLTINYYYLFEIFYSNSNDGIINKKLIPIFKIDKNQNKNLSKKDIKKNDLISAENLLSELLMNIPDLDTIEINNNNNMKLILKDISLYLKHKYNIMDNFNYSNDDQKITIPPEWYINSFSKSLEKMDEKYKKKEYEKFFIKFKKNIENSINEYGFDFIGKISECLNNIIKCRKEQIAIQEIIEEINLNNKIKEFINNEIIEVEIKFKYDENKKYFQVYKKEINNDKETNFIFDNIKLCYNILEFVQNFPDLIITQKYYNINIFDIENELKVGECLNSYFDIINEKLSKIISEETKDEALLKIKKYIFEKLYFKLFPKYTEAEDQRILSKINSLQWAKPENFNLYNFDFDSIIPITNDFFKQIDIQRYPSGKLNIFKKIFEIIFNVLNYMKEDNYSDEDISNICQYIIIKGKPEKISSNIRYLEIFENKEIIKANKKYIKQLKESIDNILKLNYKSFKGMSETEFNNKCRI